jgi:hypothetical protein
VGDPKFRHTKGADASHTVSQFPNSFEPRLQIRREIENIGRVVVRLLDRRNVIYLETARSFISKPRQSSSSLPVTNSPLRMWERVILGEASSAT